MISFSNKISTHTSTHFTKLIRNSENTNFNLQTNRYYRYISQLVEIVPNKSNPIKQKRESSPSIRNSFKKLRYK